MKNVIISYDQKLVKVAINFVLNLLENITDKEQLRIYNIVDSTETFQYLKDKASIYYPNLELIFLPAERLIQNTHLKMHGNEHLSIATYYRLFFMDEVEEGIYFYFDVDMFIRENIDDLFKIKLNSPIAAVKHFEPKEEYRLFKSSKSTYFNAGLIVFDLKKYKGIEIKNLLIKTLSERWNEIQWHDQDVLNLTFEKVWQAIDLKYNYTRNARQILSLPLEDIKIIHFDGDKKPWSNKTYHPYGGLWRDFDKSHFRFYSPKNRIQERFNSILVFYDYLLQKFIRLHNAIR